MASICCSQKTQRDAPVRGRAAVRLDAPGVVQPVDVDRQPVLGVDGGRDQPALARQLDPLPAARARAGRPSAVQERQRLRLPARKSGSWSDIVCDFPPSNSSSSDVGSAHLAAPPHDDRGAPRPARPPRRLRAPSCRASFAVTVVFASPSPKTPRGSRTRSLRTEATSSSRMPGPLHRLLEERALVPPRHLGHDRVEVVARGVAEAPALVVGPHHAGHRLGAHQRLERLQGQVRPLRRS